MTRQDEFWFFQWLTDGTRPASGEAMAYAEQVFADRTVIVSDRTQYAAELFIRSGRLRVVTLD